MTVQKHKIQFNAWIPAELEIEFSTLEKFETEKEALEFFLKQNSSSYKLNLIEASMRDYDSLITDLEEHKHNY